MTEGENAKRDFNIYTNLVLQVLFGSKSTFNNFIILVGEKILNTYLLFLLVEIIYDDTNKQVQGEEGSKDDENDKVKIHI